jgi:glycogen debranching enzyme
VAENLQGEPANTIHVKEIKRGAKKLPVVGRRRGLQVAVGPSESREYLLTNKEKAYFAGETGSTNTRSYEGLIVELHKFLEGWDLVLGDMPLSTWGTKNACVLPQSMTREYVFEGTTETVFLADDENVMIITFASSYRGSAAFVPRIDIRSIWEEGRPGYESCWDADGRTLALRRIDHEERTEERDYPVWIAIACDRPADFTPRADYRETTYTKDAARRAMGSAAPYIPGRIEFEFSGDEPFAASVTFSIAVADTLEEATGLARQGLSDEFALYDIKMRRISEILDGVGVTMRDNDYRYALLWAAASLDALIMNQMGRGIFAGLHWFPNYWGRDTFISLPGAALVRGEFETARDILETFAGLQDVDERSPSYGRIPNLAMPGEVYYNTADGTWWFVRETYEYLRYTGDTDFAVAVLPTVARAIEAVLATRVDEHNLNVHGEAETWMDAGGEAHAFSPRGNRAVEIQVLWYTALESGASIAEAAGSTDHATRWRGIAEGVRAAFEELFWCEERSGLYDHINADGTPDLMVRPNQLFAATAPWNALLGEDREEKLVRHVRATCALPHGVASLDPSDPAFHPRHLDLERYHFDEAYHNGDVWVWLTGPLVTALVKHGMVGEAWYQTKVLADLMFEEGAAGTLPELRNGVPPEEGDNVAGAVSQAWSLAEFLRNFYQDYLGVRPNLLEGTIEIRPSLPKDVPWLTAPVRLGAGFVSLFYEVDASADRATYSVAADDQMQPLTIRLAARVPPCADVQDGLVEAEAELAPGGAVEFDVVRGAVGWEATVRRSAAGAGARSRAS